MITMTVAELRSWIIRVMMNRKTMTYQGYPIGVGIDRLAIIKEDGKQENIVSLNEVTYAVCSNETMILTTDKKEIKLALTF